MRQRSSFLPAPRRARRLARKRRAFWTLLNLATAAGGVVSVLLTRLFLAGDAAVTEEALLSAQNRLESIQAEHAALADALVIAQAELAAHTRATVHPDWSILLAFIERACRGVVVLDRFELVSHSAQSSDSETDDATKPQETYRVEIEGRAPDQRSVAGLLLELERVDIFESIVLEESERGEAGAVRFTVLSTLGSPPGDLVETGARE